MEVNKLFISLIILLVPGIIATIILDSAAQHKKWDNFTFSIYVILFGCAGYFVLFVIETLIKLKFAGFQFSVFRLLSDLDNIRLEPNIYWDVFFVSIIGFGLSLLAARAVNHKWLTRFMSRWNISEKYGDESLFYYYLNWWKPSDKSVWLTVRDYSKRIVYTGDLSSFSEQDGMQEILLLNVDVYPDGKESYHLDEIYIAAKIGDISLEPMTIVQDKGTGEQQHE